MHSIETCYSTGSIVLVIGTRPEAIKMLPLYWSLQEKNIPVTICFTGQHEQLVEEIFTLFGINPDYRLNIMKERQDLFHITEAVLEKTKKLFLEIKPRLIVVQGDTSSAMVSALSAFYLHIPIAHVEAGLRTGNMLAPFPEEMNRRFISILAQWHFAPTEQAKQNLLNEGIDTNSVFVTGNSVVDMLFLTKTKILNGSIAPSSLIQEFFSAVTPGKKVLLFTAHRRETIGEGLLNIFEAMKDLLKQDKDLYILYPMHPNPRIRELAQKSQIDQENRIFITPPLSYPDMVYALTQSNLVASDSGGVQEETISLNKPLLILRSETDRPEGLQKGKVVLVGTDRGKIVEQIQTILYNDQFQPDLTSSVYGDGEASHRMAQIIYSVLE